MCETCVAGTPNVKVALDLTGAVGALAQTAPSLTQIPAAVERTGYIISDIEQAFDVLHQRLAVVSRYSPSPGITRDEEQPYRAPLADTIEGYNDRLAVLHTRVLEAIQSLEV